MKQPQQDNQFLTQEHSYGAILYTIYHNLRYIILIGAIRNNEYLGDQELVGSSPQTLKIEYGFPKGHPEPEDRSILDTILRELREETGIQAQDINTQGFNEQKPAFSLTYPVLKKSGHEILKTSTYYSLALQQQLSPDHILHVPRGFEHEIHDIRLVPEDQVSNLLSHSNEQQLFTQWLGQNPL